MDTKTMRVDTSQAILITKQDNLLTVRETDWKRLKRLVNTCKISTEWWSIAASVLFGIAGSAALSAITLLNDDASLICIYANQTLTPPFLHVTFRTLSFQT